MAWLDRMAADMGLPDRRPLLIGMVLTVAVHICLIVVLATAGGASGDVSGGLMAGTRKMCGDTRCPEPPFMSLRRGDDPTDAMDAGIIEASVVPMLGMAKKMPGQLPRFQKYEQAARTDEAVNISKDNQNNKEIKNKDVKAKDAELDRRRKNKDLGDILDDVPDTDDPRARATALDKILGSENGSVYGYGTESKEGSEYGAKVGEAIRAQFTIPPYLTEAQLRKLTVSIQISKISAAGQILEYKVVTTSGDQNFNNAALYAIRRFSGKDGGSAFLPAPDMKTLDFVNRRGIRVDLNGALFRR